MNFDFIKRFERKSKNCNIFEAKQLMGVKKDLKYGTMEKGKKRKKYETKENDTKMKNRKDSCWTDRISGDT